MTSRPSGPEMDMDIVAVTSYHSQQGVVEHALTTALFVLTRVDGEPWPLCPSDPQKCGI